MGNYKLIDLDRDEKSIVRRALYQESKTGEQAITRIFSGIQQEHGFSKANLIKARWETSVHPLYFGPTANVNVNPGRAAIFGRASVTWSNSCRDSTAKSSIRPFGTP